MSTSCKPILDTLSDMRTMPQKRARYSATNATVKKRLMAEMLTSLSPEKILRVIMILCLVAMGVAMIAVARQPGVHTPDLERTRELIGYFFVALLLYGLFYLQYGAVERYLKVQFNPGLGYLQSLGSFSVLLIGAVGLLTRPDVFNAQIESGMHSRGYLLSAAILGEAVFLGNILWAYRMQPRYVARPLADISAPIRSVQSAPRTPALGSPLPRPDLTAAWYWGWPKSPVHLFGITASLLILGGLVSLLFNVPPFKVALPWPGQVRLVHMGVYLWFGALPFVLFTALYWFTGGQEGLLFNDKLNRFHFWVAMIALIDSVRLATNWVTSQVSTVSAGYLRNDALEVGALLLLALLICISNIVVSQTANSSSRPSQTRTR